MENITPMLKQYQGVKARHKDCILFFRLGDFYEMFYEDAHIGAKTLDLVLTSRGQGEAGKIPMCGLPYHAADSYISKLVKSGFKVAICEQVEEPSKTKAIVRREVTRIISAGTFIDDNNADCRYLASLCMNKDSVGISFVDVTGGTIYTNQYDSRSGAMELIYKLPIYECIFPEGDKTKMEEILKQYSLKSRPVMLSSYSDWCFNPEIAKKSLCEHFHTFNLKGFGIDELPMAIASSGALLEYLKQMNRQPLYHIDKITLYSDTDYVFISAPACFGLELDELRKTIDHTLTSLGRRLFRYWLYHPLKDCCKILERQEAITLLKDNTGIRDKLAGILRHIPDIEKSISRISCGWTSSRDLLSLRTVLVSVPQIQEVLSVFAGKSPFFVIEDIQDLRILLERAINPDIPTCGERSRTTSHPEGNVIRQGYNEELDYLRGLQDNGREHLRNLQSEEIKRTGINSLKIGYNKIFGYYIEITKPNISLVPADYIRKQTLINAERFIIPQLKEFEEKMFRAEENILKIENELIAGIQKEILKKASAIHKLADTISALDALYSLSVIAGQPSYVCPVISQDSEIIIEEGSHPVVEKISLGSFIANDTRLDCNENHLLIITGPNMAGKSTYIRQTAILVIMAQMGGFIPAKAGRIGIVDKIFTRIGAHDDITRGQSTFMVEMNETAEILNNMTERSLVILDEIGRGTSTCDGLSLAWAVAEYLQRYKVRTLFATHFHELTALAEKYTGVKNYNVAVKEWNEEIIFLHKILPGGSDDSYGIYVARLAGIPRQVVERAKQVLTQLELQGSLKEKMRNCQNIEGQLSLFSSLITTSPSSPGVIPRLRRDKLPVEEKGEGGSAISTEGNSYVIKLLEDIKGEINNLDINSLTPIEALNKINEWKRRIIEDRS